MNVVSPFPLLLCSGQAVLMPSMNHCTNLISESTRNIGKRIHYNACHDLPIVFTCKPDFFPIDAESVILDHFAEQVTCTHATKTVHICDV